MRQARWTAALPVLVMVWSWRRRGATVASLGLGWRNFGRSFVDWWPWWAASGLGVAAIVRGGIFAPHVLTRSLIYFLWCSLQQLALESMVYLPVRESFSPFPAALLAGALFAVVHAPNPVLVPATFVWGAIACLLFERRRSIWGLALMQVLLSAALLTATPKRLNHGFRVGPGFSLRAQRPPVRFFSTRTTAAR